MIEGSATNRVRTLRFLHGEVAQSASGQRTGVTRQAVAAIEAGDHDPLDWTA